MYWIK